MPDQPIRPPEPGEYDDDDEDEVELCALTVTIAHLLLGSIEQDEPEEERASDEGRYWYAPGFAPASC